MPSRGKPKGRNRHFLDSRGNYKFICPQDGTRDWLKRNRYRIVQRTDGPNISDRDGYEMYLFENRDFWHDSVTIFPNGKIERLSNRKKVLL